MSNPPSPPTGTTNDRQSQPQSELPPNASNRPQLMHVNSTSPSSFDPRYFSKRARELQSQESLWPQMSGNSPLASPKRELESMLDGAPKASELAASLKFDLSSSNASATSSTSSFGPVFPQRARAGTLPSRLSAVTPGSQLLSPPESSIFSKSALATSVPSPSSFNTKLDQDGSLRLPPGSFPPHPIPSPHPQESAVHSRYRSGSLNLSAPRPSLHSAFGSSVFSNNTWNESSSPLSPDMPALRTLDYLGLEDSPQSSPVTATASRLPQGVPEMPSRRLSVSNGSLSSVPSSSSFMGDMARLRTDANRLRSYSVNASERYEETQNGAALEELTEESDEHHDYDQLGHLGGHQSASARPRSRTTAGPDLQSRIKAFAQVPSRLDYSKTTEQTTLLSTGDISTADESNIVNSLDDKSVGPTRALWIGNLPLNATVSFLTSIFTVYGTVESTRILSNRACGFVNYANIDAAIQAKAALNGTEISPGSGPLRIGYAKVVTSLDKSSAANSVYAVKDIAKLDKLMSLQSKRLQDLEYDILDIVSEYGADGKELARVKENLAKAISFNSFIEELPPLPDPSPDRVYDAPKLRDIRKRIDNANCTVAEIESIALDMLDEIVELASDYLGNTVVQKLFDNCSEEIKTKMLRRLAPYLAQLGMHKNGTWAAQKVIDVARTPSQMEIIADSLRPFTVHLFLDQFGNYVLQCCLRFGAPYNDFIFETMLSRFWDIAQGRFGARAMRACLESHYANKEQQRVLAAAITLHAVQIATNANGALLLTWFLDTCTLPNRHRILAPRLIPHLVSLCTHKLASLTVLKVVNYRAEPEARRAIFDALIHSPNDALLEEILSDNAQGPLVIYKILSTPFLEADLRQQAIAAVRSVLVRLKVNPSQGYRRLMDEVGLSTRGSGLPVAGAPTAIPPAKSLGHHHNHHNHPPIRPYQDVNSLDYMQQQPQQQLQSPFTYYGNGAYDPASLDYGRQEPAVMDYLAAQLGQTGITSLEQTYGQMGMHQQSMPPQSMRGQSPYYGYIPASPPPQQYAESYRPMASPQQNSSMMYSDPLSRGPIPSTIPPHAQGSNSNMNGSQMMYPNYPPGMTPLYSPPAQQGSRRY